MIGDRPIRLEVDGGVTRDNAAAVAAAGADTLVAGSAVFRGKSAAEYAANIAPFAPRPRRVGFRSARSCRAADAHRRRARASGKLLRAIAKRLGRSVDRLIGRIFLRVPTENPTRFGQSPSCRGNQRCRSTRAINGDAMRRSTICGSRAAESVGCTFNIFTGMLLMAGAVQMLCESPPSSCSISAAVSNWRTASAIATCAVSIPKATSLVAAPADKSMAMTSAMTKSLQSPCASPQTQVRLVQEVVEARDAVAGLRRALLPTRRRRPICAGLFVLSDGLVVNGGELLAGITEVLGPDLPGYRRARRRRHPVRADDALEPTPNRRRTASPPSAFYGASFRFAHGCAGGWDVFGPRRKVTKSEAVRVVELDGEPPLDLYTRYLGEEEAEAMPGSGLAFPCAFTMRPSRTGRSYARSSRWIAVPAP